MKDLIEHKKDSSSHDFNTYFIQQLNQLEADQKGQELIENIKLSVKPNLLAIIGSRKAENLSLQWTKDLVKVAVAHGFIVISGGAQGVDQQAHIESVHCGGQSLAIIACGLNKASHRLQNLAKKGVGLASPFLSHYPPQVWTYPKRNQYIADLCDGLMVIQAAEGSGSLLTARKALKLGKKVWVLPHQPNHKAFKGSLQLLREGAWPLLSTHSWLEDFKDELDNDLVMLKAIQSSTSIVELKQHSSSLWKAAGDQARSLESLAIEAALSYDEALLEATQLELEGWLTLVVGVGYKKAYV